ncbi:metalloendoproteinase 3-MMP-like [Andrographis paniculata]|uniref:metalloendoproteinase 3-MMP-like n=1 Tax=Andrographis paniculata TaxID=175694 RepID=UPI0021E98948|nr:metalloendoproteinase 3-MMP-like [Andrographis paniculata]
MAILKTLYLLPLIFIFALICTIVHSKRDHSSPSPIDFNDLQGSHKGSSIKGLHKLKHYLEQFGYLNYENKANLNDDEFDAKLESALKTYQENFHISCTGILDAATLAKINVPRCGVPDIINGTNAMVKKNHSDPLSESINIVSHYTFFNNRPRWPLSQTHLTYRFLPNTHIDAITAVDRAFRTWEAATRFSFSRVRNNERSDISIGFFSGDHGDGRAFSSGEGGALAHAFAPTDGRFHFNGAKRWGNGRVPGRYDLFSVGLHEIGHLLGLGHSQHKRAIMYPSFSPGQTKRLTKDDIDGIRALYS